MGLGEAVTTWATRPQPSKGKSFNDPWTTVTVTPWADPGVGVGSRSPFFGPFAFLVFNIGPNIGPPPRPPFFACRPKMAPPFKNPGSAPAHPSHSQSRPTGRSTQGSTSIVGLGGLHIRYIHRPTD